jgi:hypothetical protein
MLEYGYAIIDKDGKFQGMDMDSGGCQFPTYRIRDVNVWPQHFKTKAEAYCKIINYGNKGYKLVKVTLSLEETQE